MSTKLLWLHDSWEASGLLLQLRPQLGAFKKLKLKLRLLPHAFKKSRLWLCFGFVTSGFIPMSSFKGTRGGKSSEPKVVAVIPIYYKTC